MSLVSDIITKTIRDTIVGVLRKDSTPVSNIVVEQVATKVTNEVAPIAINAANAEPWYKSRIYWGLIVAGVGAIGSRYGLLFGVNDIQMLSDLVPKLIVNVSEILQVIGTLYAAYGRIMGSKLKPIGG